MSLAPYNLIIMSFAGLTVFAWLALQAQSKKSLFFNSLLFGFGMFAVGVSWVYVSIHVYGEAPPVLALLMTFVFVLFLAFLFAVPWLLLRHLPSGPIFQIFCFAALWLTVEWIRGWIFTGFPWLYIGQGHLTSPLAGWLPLIGSLGVGFVQAALCATLALAIKSVVDTKKISASIAMALAISATILILSPLLNRISWTTPLDPIDVTLIQPNIPLQDKWNAELRDINLQILLDLSDDSWGSDILVWPEAALPLTTLGSDGFLIELASKLEPGSSLITGRLVYDSENRRFYNNVIGLGNAKGEYSKRRLVPFGEYVPLENQLRGLIEFFDLPMSVISSGISNQNLLTAGDLNIAIALCYEIAYGNQVARDSGDANLLVTVSNDTWFGDSIGPHQHFEIAQIRARETGKPVLRGTNNGISGVIDARGQVIAASEQFVATSQSTEVTPYSGITPFARWGQLPIVLFALLFLLGAVFQQRQARS